jgi:hypothetical protein
VKQGLISAARETYMFFIKEMHTHMKETKLKKEKRA